MLGVIGLTITTQMPEEQIIIVDAEDNIKYYKPRSEFTSGEINRSVALWLTNSWEEALIARRGKRNEASSGLYCPPAMGTVPRGEEYHDTIIREVKEELGLELMHNQLQTDTKVLVERTGKDNFTLCQYYDYNDPDSVLIENLTPDPNEIMSLEWMSIERVRSLCNEQPQMCMNMLLARFYKEW